MTLRHAATLALLGWYLMVPPFHQDSEGTIDGIEPDAPLSAWKVEDSFDSASDCRAGQDAYPAKVKQALSPVKVSDVIKAFYFLAAAKATCIATNDPRLKGE